VSANHLGNAPQRQLFHCGVFVWQHDVPMKPIQNRYVTERMSNVGTQRTSVRNGEKTVSEGNDARSHDLAEQLRDEVAAHDATRRELETARREADAVRREAQVRLYERTRERDAARARFQTALHGAKIYVFSQDRELRYTFVSQPMFGLTAEEFLGHTDDDVIPAFSRSAIIAAKREVLATGQARDAEYRIQVGDDARWYDFHIDALRDGEGTVLGLTGAAVDITERKEGEAHLRLLMRELTHRSKNLLAVIQAMARQTAKHTGNVDRFLQYFGERLQALARSHDLLVQESWHGASLDDLVRSQLAPYLGHKNSQVTVEGDDIQLRPEAAQGLGLALHELATNAAKHGALSRVRGHVDVTWKRLPPGEGGALAVQWIESKGPKVSEPTRRGFGSMVIEHNLTRALGANVSLNFKPEGLECRIVLPGAQILPDRPGPER
jgi:PAS domain S-box-containing protein